MRSKLRWLSRGIVIAVMVLMLGAVIKRDELHLFFAVTSVFDERRIVENFSNMDKAFLTVDVPRGDGPVVDLPQGPAITMPNDFEKWIEERAVTSFMVLHNGEIVHEGYYKDTVSTDRRIGWALSKAYISALTGIALERGQIGSLDDKVTSYLPQLIDTAYNDVQLIDLLQMTSGIEFDEDYLDYNSDINRMARKLALGGSIDEFVTMLKDKSSAPGERWQYISINAHVMAMVLRKVTGQDLARLLSDQVIAPMGLEADPYYMTDGNDAAFSVGGINKTTRDYARFGLMYEQMGELGGRQIVPSDWIAMSTRQTTQTDHRVFGYSYLWWVPKDTTSGQFLANGVYGQYLYVDPSKNLVIVQTAADLKFRDPGVEQSNLDYFRKIADSL